MTALTQTQPADQASPSLATGRRVTQAKVVRSEWTKLRSQPSAAWSLLTAVALIVGFGVLYSLVRVTRPPHSAAEVASFDPTAISLAGAQLAQVAVGVLGVLLVTGEYATGLIRTSMVAVPRRLPVLWAKAIVLALTGPVVFLPATLAAFLVGQSVLSRERLGTSLQEPWVTRAVLGSALFLTAVGLLGLGLGALLRSTAGAIASLFGVLFGLQIVVGFLPASVADTVTRYLPTPAGAAVTTVRPDPSSLAPWAGFGLFCLYTAVALALAAWLLRRRDV
jgi:ABC-2 type transport system permease protein